MAVFADLDVVHAGGNLGHVNGDVTVGLQHRGVDVANEFAHMVSDFFLALHGGYVDFF